MKMLHVVYVDTSTKDDDDSDSDLILNLNDVVVAALEKKNPLRSGCEEDKLYNEK